MQRSAFDVCFCCAILANRQLASALHTSSSTSHRRARCAHIDSQAPQHDFLQFQDSLDFAGLTLVGGLEALSSNSAFEFEWGTRLESECTETTKGHQLGLTTYTAAARDLERGGIVMCGDSVTRNLFASICGFHSGMSIEELEEYNGILKNRSNGDESVYCSKANIVFAPWYQISSASSCIDTIQTTKAKYKFVSMPGLHTLWSPGDREVHGTACTFDTMDEINQALSRTISLLAPHGVIFGVATAICDAKLGKEGALCKIYKLQRKLARSGGNPTDASIDLDDRSYSSAECVADFIASESARQQPTQESAAYLESINTTGIIRPTPWRHCSPASDADDKYDSLLFIEEGMRNFKDMSMRMLETFPANLVVNMHRATEGRCDFTGDGRHYRDPVKNLQASLLATAWKLQESLAT